MSTAAATVALIATVSASAAGSSASVSASSVVVASAFHRSFDQELYLLESQSDILFPFDALTCLQA
jgi:hypothetical protein